MMVGGSTGGTNEPDWSLDQALAQIQQLVGMVNNLQHTIAQQGQTIAQLQAQATPQEFPNLWIKITWVLGFMQTGMAQLFHDHFLIYMATLEFHTQYEELSELDQIKLLYQDIYKAFGDLNKQATAIQEITTIKQGS
ncbi:hypothetical protein AMATHDRAFT_11274 [Amanita thiersii Skay4041]|uniref:Uncharacterized protein n=1 Tax=Amanita thiersii Skay4041 TaxID=703135 RepID=A0A2A9NA60_9AGAR|nr:hypothetical protein AMATHDRAFT_11274 [Amanita thiersii Skay4041]